MTNSATLWPSIAGIAFDMDKFFGGYSGSSCRVADQELRVFYRGEVTKPLREVERDQI